MMNDPVKKAIFEYSELGEKEDSLGVKAINHYNLLLEVAANRKKLLRRAHAMLEIGMPRLIELIEEIAEELGDDK